MRTKRIISYSSQYEVIEGSVHIPTTAYVPDIGPPGEPFLDHLYAVTYRHSAHRTQGIGNLRGLGIQSKADLLRVLPALSGQPLLAAIDAVVTLKIRRSSPLLAHLIPF